MQPEIGKVPIDFMALASLLGWLAEERPPFSEEAKKALLSIGDDLIAAIQVRANETLSDLRSELADLMAELKTKGTDHAHRPTDSKKRDAADRN